MLDLTIIIVCYNSSPFIAELLTSAPKNVAVVLVNNSQDDCLDRFVSDQVQVIRLNENVGFGVACNIGAITTDTRYLLFLNPDTRLQPGTADALMQSAKKYPDASAFNPIIVNKFGSISNKRRSILLPRKDRLLAQTLKYGGVAPVLTGAALMVRRDVFHKVGGFDPSIFLYHEDDDLSIRLKKFGPLRIVESAKVRHEGGHGSGDRVASASLKAFYMGQSRVYAMCKHNRPLPLVNSLALAVIQLLSPIAWISRRKRAKHINFLRGILSAMKLPNGSS